MADYALRDSITARRCDRRSPQPKELHDTQRTQGVPRQRRCERRGARDETPLRPACGARNESSEPTIKIRGALVHMHCVVPRLGGALMTSPRSDPNLRSRPTRRGLRVGDRSIALRVVEASSAQGRPAAVIRRPSGSGTKRLDPEVLVAHLGHLLSAAWALCGSRESAEDLVQETVARILSRPRLLRADDERAYLMRTLRNTFLTSRRTAARRPHVVTTLQDLDAADPRAGARPEEAVIAAQVFPVIARLPEPFRSTLVAVDVAGLSYREAARALGAPEATITTRLYRARQRVARELDPERFGAARSKSARDRDGDTHNGSATAPRNPCEL
jgi:RNA polymerase sigma-70 factor (ECF subfamily)